MLLLMKGKSGEGKDVGEDDPRPASSEKIEAVLQFILNLNYDNVSLNIVL